MSSAVVCDNCGETTTWNPDDTLWWCRVGWANGATDDACSLDCARALLEAMQLQRWEIEQQIEAENAAAQ